jgi:putative transcriptional regulator
MKKIDPPDIKAARLAVGLTQTQAGTVLGASCRIWQKWEWGEASLHSIKFAYFKIVTGLAPVALLDGKIIMPKIIAHRSDSGRVLLVESDAPGYCRVCDLDAGTATPKLRVEDAIVAADWVPMEGNPALMTEVLTCREAAGQS